MNVEDELLLAAEESCVPWVVEEFAVEEAVSVVTELAAAVFLPEVEAAGACTRGVCRSLDIEVVQLPRVFLELG